MTLSSQAITTSEYPAAKNNTALDALLGLNRRAAYLVLADGTVFQGYGFGATSQASAEKTAISAGEVVFNTALTGYQEVITDPSYARQIVTLTYPHIGNVGVNEGDAEATALHCAGLIIKDLPNIVSNWRSETDLSTYLARHNILGLAGIDTRALTVKLRQGGAQNGAIVSQIGFADKAAAIAAGLEAAKSFAGLAGMDLAKVVSTKNQYPWTEGEWQLGTNAHQKNIAQPFHVVAYDFGAKHNILRMLAQRGCRLTVVPAQTSAADVFALNPDGVFLSNGPGDPEPCDYAITATREFLARKLPVFGICLGHQILGLALGAKTLKMKTGHHGANHPVKDLDTQQVLITSQNHGFAVDAATLPTVGDMAARVTHVSLFDGTLQGLACVNTPAFSFQGHPEASPGPHDIGYLFDRFVAILKARAAGNDAN